MIYFYFGQKSAILSWICQLLLEIHLELLQDCRTLVMAHQKEIKLWIKKKEQQAAFKKLKQKFCKESVLKIYNPEKLAILKINTSDYTIRACLNQPDKKERLYSIIYYFRKITPSELNYNIHDKELLAIVAALKEWRHYLKKAKHQTLIYCDHKNLVHFTTIKKLTWRQAR